MDSRLNEPRHVNGVQKKDIRCSASCNAGEDLLLVFTRAGDRLEDHLQAGVRLPKNLEVGLLDCDLLRSGPIGHFEGRGRTSSASDQNPQSCCEKEPNAQAAQRSGDVQKAVVIGRGHRGIKEGCGQLRDR